MERPVIQDLERMMANWTPEETYAFFCCVRPNERTEPNDMRHAGEEAIVELFWAYNSKLRASAARGAAKSKEAIYKKMPDRLRNSMSHPESVGELYEYATSLSFEFLLRECCKKLGIEDAHVLPADQLEIYLCEFVIAKALVAMTAEQRHAFITRAVPLEDFKTDFVDSGAKAPLTTLAALGSAQASGFGTYLAATTSLGFLSHAIGVTLPFAVYTGMTSTIAFLIGPAGFVAGTAWLGASLTAPEWGRILRGLLHVIAMNAKHQPLPTQLARAATAT